MTEPTRDRQGLLRYALVGNASFSAITGLLIIIAHDWIAQLLGIPGNASLVALGIGLLVFAGALLLNARRPELKLAEARAVVAMDLAWVVGSYVILFVAPFSGPGKWVVAMVADVVLVFAVLQWVGISRIHSYQQRSQA